MQGSSLAKELAIHRPVDMMDAAVRADDERNPVGHFVGHEHTVSFRHPAFGIGKERKVQMLFLDKPFMGFYGIRAYSEHDRVLVGYLAHRVPESLHFARSPTGEVFRIERQDHRLSAIIA